MYIFTVVTHSGSRGEVGCGHSNAGLVVNLMEGHPDVAIYKIVVGQIGVMDKETYKAYFNRDSKKFVEELYPS